METAGGYKMTCTYTQDTFHYDCGFYTNGVTFLKCGKSTNYPQTH